MKKLDKYVEQWKENQSVETLKVILNEVYKIKDNEERAKILKTLKDANKEKFMNQCINDLKEDWTKIVYDEGFGEYVLGNFASNNQNEEDD